MMKKSAILAGTLGLALVMSVSALAEDPSFEERVRVVVDQLDADVQSDRGLAGLFAVMLGEEYGALQTEIRWALDKSLSWGGIAVLSYLQATTGRSFEELTGDEAHTNVFAYVTRMEMSHDRMVRSLEYFARSAVEERNSRIFDRLRSSQRVAVLPDLGTGFGLFQEALDLRGVGPPSPTKIHSGRGFIVTDGRENQ